ncbi:MAG: four helix bundle protein [Gemmatimonadetes bacterium]|nr:four helix bundle protein [Gemmatimonadota bacterium]
MSDHGREDREPRVVRLALDLVEFCDRIEAKILRKRKVALNDHLQDSAASALANVGEGWDDPNPREKRRFFHYALRSGGECQRQLRGVARVRAISPEELAEGMRLLLDLKLDLLRLIAWCDRTLAD